MTLSKYLISPAILALFTISCNQSTEDFEFIPRNSFHFEKVEIEAGSPVRILAYSGGVQNRNAKVHYSQFLCVAKNSADTVIVLSPLVSYNKSDTDSGIIHSLAFNFNPPPDLLNATFTYIDSVQLELLIRTERFANEKNGKLENHEEEKKGKLQHLVIVNKEMALYRGTRAKESGKPEKLDVLQLNSKRIYVLVNIRLRRSLLFVAWNMNKIFILFIGENLPHDQDSPTKFWHRDRH